MKKIIHLIILPFYFGWFYPTSVATAQNPNLNNSAYSKDSSTVWKRLNFLSDNPKISDLDLLVDSTLQSYMQSPQTCGISIGIRYKSTTYFYNYGELIRDSKRLPDTSSIYEIGSLTTTYTSYLLAKAVCDSLISLEEDIRKYLPETFKRLHYKGTKVRVKHLANHTSGLPNIPTNLKTNEIYDQLNPYVNYSKENLNEFLKTVELKIAPGTQFQYSSLGMAILGLIFEEVYKRPYEVLLQEAIVDAFQLNSTYLRVPEQARINFAGGYNQEGKSTPHWEMGLFNPAGGLRSTVADVLRWTDLNKHNNAREFNLTQTISFQMKEKIGLSWFVKKTKFNNTLYWHDGATFGFSSFCGFLKEKNCSVVVLSNSAQHVDFIALAILNYLQNGDN